jgi:hypothetical protein
MSLSNAAETALLNLLFVNTDWANIGDAAGLQNSVAAGSFYISLHTADPGEAGTQATSETAYTGYARVAVARSGAGWTVSGASVSNAAAVTFGTCTASPGAAITHFGIGTDVSGAGNLILSGTSAYTVSVSNAPNFPIGAMTTTAD